MGVLAGAGAGTARADLNFAIQAASSKQTAVAVAPAIQYSGKDSFNLNVSRRRQPTTRRSTSGWCR